MAAHVTFIGIEKVLELISNKDTFVIVEALSAEDYAKGHIPGAISIPGEEIRERAAKALPDKNQTIVTYCSGYKCGASTEAARALMELGYKNVLDFKGGKKHWEASGMPLQKS